LFNRKSTENTQLIHRLELRLEAIERAIEAEKSANRQNLLEYAELGDKMRHLYQRIARRQKIAGEETSDLSETPADTPEPSPKEIRESIEAQLHLID